MTGDGGEYLRAEDLRDLGDDSLPGHYLDFSYMNNMNIDRWKSDKQTNKCVALARTNTVTNRFSLLQVTAHSHSPKLYSEGRVFYRRHAHKPPGEESLSRYRCQRIALRTLFA